MIGIYKVTNLINNKVYIGQSIDIERRKYSHIYSSSHPNTSDYNVRFHQAIRKYGIENFKWDILIELKSEEYSKEILDKLETEYIALYHSYDFNKGYNATLGGLHEFGNKKHLGESNGRALLNIQDVKDIRIKYNAHIPFRIVYDEYKDKISKRGLQKVWYYETWKDIFPEFDTLENKYWHSHNAKANSKEVASNNKRGFSKEEVIQMRNEYNSGMTAKQIQEKYYPKKAYSTIRNMLVGKTYKDIK